MYHQNQYCPYSSHEGPWRGPPEFTFCTQSSAPQHLNLLFIKDAMLDQSLMRLNKTTHTFCHVERLMLPMLLMMPEGELSLSAMTKTIWLQRQAVSLHGLWKWTVNSIWGNHISFHGRKCIDLQFNSPVQGISASTLPLRVSINPVYIYFFKPIFIAVSQAFHMMSQHIDYNPFGQTEQKEKPSCFKQNGRWHS